MPSMPHAPVRRPSPGPRPGPRPRATARPLARVLWTAAVVCVAGVVGTVVGGAGPASADEAGCVAHMEWAGIAAWEPAHHLMEDACHEGVTSGQTHACRPPMLQAIKRHNDETGWPLISGLHALHACDLAVHPWPRHVWAEHSSELPTPHLKPRWRP